MKTLPACPCEQDHTAQFNKDTRRALRRIIARQGRVQLITTPDGSWRVPRIFIAAHGLDAADLPLLAAAFGWPKEGHDG